MRKLSVDCGKHRLPTKQVNHLAALGQAIDRGDQPLVYDGGFVGLARPTESEVIEHAPLPSTRNRSETGSRQGWRASARQRPNRKAKPFRSDAIEAAHGTGFRLLVQHYEALGFEDKNGLWVAAKSKPLGLGGPQAFFLIALPNIFSIYPRAWAFSAIGNRTVPFPLKHTNFPDGSICAFTKESGAWQPGEGILELVDHYSLWALKSLHRATFGWWPGPQVGVGALYRRNEFAPQEWCGCGSGRRYVECHQAQDNLVVSEHAEREFRYLYRSNYTDRDFPQSLIMAATTRWKIIPDMSAVWEARAASDEPNLTSV